MTDRPKLVFVGGHSKSGTTFIGRALGLFNDVCSKGELDYFRLYFKELNTLTDGYNVNIDYVNREVYDGIGNLGRIDDKAMVRIHRSVFMELFQSGVPVPADSKFWVEKSPQNVHWTNAINFIFPEAVIVAVYRDPVAVFRSRLRHMADHRDGELKNVASPERQEFRRTFIEGWYTWIGQLEKYKDRLMPVNYQHVVDDTKGFLDFAAERIFKEDLGLKAPVETLSKEYYLSQLPEERRAKSLVQTNMKRLTLSEKEISIIKEKCRSPEVPFAF